MQAKAFLDYDRSLKGGVVNDALSTDTCVCTVHLCIFSLATRGLLLLWERRKFFEGYEVYEFLGELRRNDRNINIDELQQHQHQPTNTQQQSLER